MKVAFWRGTLMLTLAMVGSGACAAEGPPPSEKMGSDPIFLLKGDSGGCVVLRDQYRAPSALHAAWCLHVRDDQSVALSIQEVGKGGDTEGSTSFADTDQGFPKLGVAAGWVLDIGAIRKGKGGNSEDVAARYVAARARGMAGRSVSAGPPSVAQLYKDLRANPQNWEHVAASGEAAKSAKASGRLSIPSWYRNKITGEEIGTHDVIRVSGKSLKNHPHPVGMKGN